MAIKNSHNITMGINWNHKPTCRKQDKEREREKKGNEKRRQSFLDGFVGLFCFCLMVLLVSLFVVWKYASKATPQKHDKMFCR